MPEGLDKDLQVLIEDLNRLGLPAMSTAAPIESREAFVSLVRAMHGDGPDELLIRAVSVSDRSVPGRDGPIPVRVYDPAGDATEPAHVVVLMHGGGWMVGDLDTHDGTARAIAAEVGARVVSVDYRRSPEHPFPAALHDCVDVVEAVHADVGTLSVSLAGDSAGGNLAAATALACREAGGPDILAQLLVYPALDPHRTGGSAVQYADGYLLTTSDMTAYDDAYLPNGADRYLPLAAPSREPNLTGCPPAVIATAGFDPLLDEGREYAIRLLAADVPTTYLPFPTLTHGWLDMTGRVPAAGRARKAVLGAFAALMRCQLESRQEARVSGPEHAGYATA